MPSRPDAVTADLGLPPTIARALDEFVAQAREAFGDDLVSLVLYGSAAEGRLRATSDVNLIAILSAFKQAAVDLLREPLRLAQAAVRLDVMFLLESEIPDAETAFAAKFADVGRRHKVLHGRDVFANRQVPRDAAIFRLKQVLLNIILRWRNAYALRGGREEALVRAVAEAAGPLRSMAATLLELEDGQVRAPKPALEEIAAALPGHESRDAVARISEARDTGVLPVGTAGPALLVLIQVAEAMRQRARALA
jgi:predicted nucleotidyltransferase